VRARRAWGADAALLTLTAAAAADGGRRRRRVVTGGRVAGACHGRLHGDVMDDGLTGRLPGASESAPGPSRKGPDGADEGPGRGVD
jgi:hypothetical protein